VYSKSPLILLDDIFSGMDASTVDHVSWELLGQGGILRNGLVTVVLATHNRTFKRIAVLNCFSANSC
jgi:ATP-binding cassette, subfamily C (CFTR/MRP), member 1